MMHWVSSLGRFQILAKLSHDIFKYPFAQNIFRIFKRGKKNPLRTRLRGGMGELQKLQD